jgi:hypothetical protein
MKNVPKKYFKRPAITEIKKDRTEVIVGERFVENIEALTGDQYALIQARILPGEARNFMHHGRLIDLDSVVESDEALGKFGIVFQRAFDRIGSKPTLGYCNKMTFGGKQRVIPFVNCLEGARIALGYSHQNIFGLRPIEVSEYDGILREGEEIEPERINVTTEGAECVISIPSRRQRVSRYAIKMHHVPVRDNEHKFDIAWSTHGELASPDQVHDIRFEGEYAPRPSNRHLVSGIEAAAMIGVAEYYWTQNKNSIPTQLCPIFLPSKDLVEFYLRLIRQCLIKHPDEDRTRQLNMPERSKLIGTYIWVNGVDKALWDYRRDGKIKDYDWKI